MTAIGETLRRERLKRNLELEQISRELKISHKFLEAIEDEQFDKLPRGVFAKSFVRQYARLLGLDEEELAAAVAPPPGGPHFAEQAPKPPPAEIHVPRVEAWEAVSEERRFSRPSALPAFAMVVVVMLVCAGIYAMWQRSRRASPPRDDTAAAQTSPAEPAAPSALLHTEPAASPEAAKPQISPAPLTKTPAQGPPPGPADSKPAASTAAASTPPEPGTQVQIPNANPRGPVQLAITADEPVWVLVKTDGKFSYTGTMEAQKTLTFDANENVTLRLGNAGGVTIKLNGQPVGAVGPKGQVRTVQFTSGGFQIVAVPKPSFPLDDLL
jgi:cytoskeleton protein RodZ